LKTVIGIVREAIFSGIGYCQILRIFWSHLDTGSGVLTPLLPTGRENDPSGQQEITQVSTVEVYGNYNDMPSSSLLILCPIGQNMI